MKIRLLPMSKSEFATMEDVMCFLTEKLPQNGGKYFYRRKSIKSKEDLIVAFQYDGKIVAGAIMVGQTSSLLVENGVEYTGYFVFEPESDYRYDDTLHNACI